MQDKFEVEWRNAETDPPTRGVFVELARADADGRMQALDKVYWYRAAWNLSGLFWRFSTPPTFRSGKDEPGIRPPIDEDLWYVVITEPGQEIRTVWRIHELGHELYVPIIRRRVPTGRTGKNGQKVTRLIARPMFPGYGMIRKSGGEIANDLRNVRGVSRLLKNEKGDFVVLPHEAVLSIFRKQSDKHLDFIRQAPARRRNRPAFKCGDAVKVEAEGSVYDGMLANVERVDGAGRIQVLFGMIRHTLPAEMVVAA